MKDEAFNIERLELEQRYLSKDNKLHVLNEVKK